jgi:hypothetical protein
MFHHHDKTPWRFGRTIFEIAAEIRDIVIQLLETQQFHTFVDTSHQDFIETMHKTVIGLSVIVLMPIVIKPSGFFPDLLTEIGCLD